MWIRKQQKQRKCMCICEFGVCVCVCVCVCATQGLKWKSPKVRRDSFRLARMWFCVKKAVSCRCKRLDSCIRYASVKCLTLFDLCFVAFYCLKNRVKFFDFCLSRSVFFFSLSLFLVFTCYSYSSSSLLSMISSGILPWQFKLWHTCKLLLNMKDATGAKRMTKASSSRLNIPSLLDARLLEIFFFLIFMFPIEKEKKKATLNQDTFYSCLWVISSIPFYTWMNDSLYWSKKKTKELRVQLTRLF